MVAFVTACRIIDTKEATEGFASSGLLTVVILFVVSVGGCTSGQTLVKCLPAPRFVIPHSSACWFCHTNQHGLRESMARRYTSKVS